MSETWRELANCRGTDPCAWFQPFDLAPLEAICAHCEVRRECLEYALTHDERDGYWGGLSEKQREAMRRGRAHLSSPSRASDSPSLVIPRPGRVRRARTRVRTFAHLWLEAK